MSEEKPMILKVPYDEIDPNDYETYSSFKSAKEGAKQERETASE